MSGDTIALHDGTILSGVHPATMCLLGNCCIHNPSDHPLNTAPLSWMGHDIRIMHRVCEHGLQHPDPDAIQFAMTVGDWMTVEAVTSVHLVEKNCDGCCRKPIRTSSTGDES